MAAGHPALAANLTQALNSRPMGLDLATFTIDSTNPAAPVVTVNGEEVQGRIRRVSFDQGVGEPPKLFLEAFTPGSIKGVGIVEVALPVGGDDSDVREAVLGWLGNLDPAELERAMLERQTEGFTSVGPGEAALAALKSWVSNGD